MPIAVEVGEQPAAVLVFQEVGFLSGFAVVLICCFFDPCLTCSGQVVPHHLSGVTQLIGGSSERKQGRVVGFRTWLRREPFSELIDNPGMERDLFELSALTALRVEPDRWNRAVEIQRLSSERSEFLAAKASPGGNHVQHHTVSTCNSVDRLSNCGSGDQTGELVIRQGPAVMAAIDVDVQPLQRGKRVPRESIMSHKPIAEILHRIEIEVACLVGEARFGAPLFGQPVGELYGFDFSDSPEPTSGRRLFDATNRLGHMKLRPLLRAQEVAILLNVLGNQSFQLSFAGIRKPGLPTFCLTHEIRQHRLSNDFVRGQRHSSADLMFIDVLAVPLRAVFPLGPRSGGVLWDTPSAAVDVAGDLEFEEAGH